MEKGDKGALEGAQWICGPAFDYGPDDVGYYDESHPNHVMSARFALPAGAEKVELVLAVLGWCVPRVNGWRVGDVELVGEWTNFSRCVYARALDATALVHEGENRVELELGNGFYNPAPLTLFGKYNLRERLSEVGTPAVLAAVVADGRVLLRTGEDWACAEGRLLFNNVYLGEVCDLRLRDQRLLPTVAVANERAIEAAPNEPCRRGAPIEPVGMAETAEGGLLIDFGEVVAGVVELRFQAQAQTRVSLFYAELLDGEGRPRFDSNVAGHVGNATPRGVCPGGPGAPERALQRDVVLVASGPCDYVTTMAWHSFRYVLVEGIGRAQLVAIRAFPVHTVLRPAGSFSCGNDAYMQLADAAVRTRLNNVHGVFEDCSRERFGYGGDMLSLASSYALAFDTQGMLDKTLADLRRDQTPRGGIPETAPFMGIGSNGPAYGEGPLLWQIAYPYLALVAHRRFGRRDLLAREWPGVAAFGDYLLSFDPAELATHCLGDHGNLALKGELYGATPDKDLLGWCAVLWGLRLVAECGRRLGADAARFDAAADALIARIRERFARADGAFGEATQSGLAFAAALGLGDASELTRRLAESVEKNDGVLACGIFGSMLAYRLLAEHGRSDVVERWLLREGRPSLRAMLASGSGALAEQFDDFLSSYDHAMFSSYLGWLYGSLAGIDVADDAVGSDHLVARPYFSPACPWAKASLELPTGRASVAWERCASGRVALAVAAPVGVRVDLVPPADWRVVSDVEEAGSRKLVLEEIECGSSAR